MNLVAAPVLRGGQRQLVGCLRLGLQRRCGDELIFLGLIAVVLLLFEFLDDLEDLMQLLERLSQKKSDNLANTTKALTYLVILECVSLSRIL